jgi:hypothetical protein
VIGAKVGGTGGFIVTVRQHSGIVTGGGMIGVGGGVINVVGG